MSAADRASSAGTQDPTGDARTAESVCRRNEQCALADRLADYMATRNTPWRDEALMREAVHATVQLLFGDARYETERMLQIDGSLSGGEGFSQSSPAPGQGQHSDGSACDG